MALNKLLTKITTISELKLLINEILFNTTSKVSKVSKTSVLNGVIYGVSKIAQKAVKDIAVIESQIFPEFASGEFLDNSARLWAGIQRLGETGSSAFIRVKADPGTVYLPGLHKFMSDSGVEFDVVEMFIVGHSGYGYVNVRSIQTGSVTNVDPFTINNVNPEPDGHISCTNEYRAINGRSVESDEVFRQRVLNSINLYSRGTLGFITEILRSFDPNVLKVINIGTDDNYVINLAVVRVNGSFYTNTELTDLEQSLLPYLSMADSISSFGQGFKLINIEWFFIGGASGVDFRVEIFDNFDIDDVRKNIQIAITKFLDFRFTEKRKILWDDLFEVIKNVDGVKFLPVSSFNPVVDQIIPENKLPRVKKFIMRDLGGSIIFDSQENVSPIFYQ